MILTLQREICRNVHVQIGLNGTERMLVLQNYAEMLKVVPSSCCETCLTSDDRNLIIDTKGEDVSEARAEDDPLLMTPQAIKAGCEVSFVSAHCCLYLTSARICPCT
jgi:hypothetical protein